MNYNDERVKDLLENVEIPEEISPENMKKMLDEKAPAKNRSSRISMAGRITAAVAACAVIVGSTVGTSGLISRNRGNDGKVTDASHESGTISDTTEKEHIEILTSPNVEAKGPYMKGAESYEQVFKLVEKAKKNMDKYYFKTYGAIVDGAVMENDVESAVPETNVERL